MIVALGKTDGQPKKATLLENKWNEIITTFICQTEKEMWDEGELKDGLSSDSTVIKMSIDVLRFGVYVRSFNLDSNLLEFTFVEMGIPNPLDQKYQEIYLKPIRYMAEIKGRKVLIAISNDIDSIQFQNLSFIKKITPEDFNYYKNKERTSGILLNENQFPSFYYYFGDSKEFIHKYYGGVPNEILYQTIFK